MVIGMNLKLIAIGAIVSLMLPAFGADVVMDGATYVARERAAYVPANYPDGPTVFRIAKPLVVWVDTAKASGYAAATAGDAKFADRALWPQITGKETFVSEKWPVTRVLIWAKPGIGGGKEANPRDGSLSVLDAANWLENGKPAEELWDEDTDLVFPEAEKPYGVNLKDCGKRQECRHVTVGRNASFMGGGDGVGRQIHGNVWIKHLGYMYAQGATGIVGGKNTFFRNDNDKNAGACSQYFAFNRRGGSVEFLGHVTCADEFQVNEGTIIVGPDSILQPGRCCAPYVAKGATLALMDNAWFGNWANTWTQPDLNVSGTLLGGLDYRPLTRSAALGLTFKNHQKAVKVADEKDPGIWFDAPRVTSLVLNAGSQVRGIAAPGSSATLVLRETGYITIVNETGVARIFPWDGMYDTARKTWPNGWKKDQWFDAYPKGADLIAFPGVVLDNVQLVGFRDKGVMVLDAKTTAAWKQVVVVGPKEAKKSVQATVIPTAKPSGTY